MERKAPTRKELTHNRILDTAAGVLRDSGFEGVAVADVMRRAGLTHGGFYAHFASRDALLAEALARAGEDSQIRLQQAITAGPDKVRSGFRALVEQYLSERHLKEAGRCCPVAALVSDVPRQSDMVRAAAVERIASLTATIASTLPHPDQDTASLIASQMVGALQIARALGDGPQGRRQLAIARTFLLEQFDTRRPHGR